jgi:gamma-aminobutyric acid receptor subunit alpha
LTQGIRDIATGVTTVLTMTFLGLEARTDLPEVSYPTALDYFVFFSFMFIFSTVVQVRSRGRQCYDHYFRRFSSML